MTELTAEKIRLAALAIEALRHAGRYDFNAEISQREFERISEEIGHPVSARDIARFEARAITKAKLAALTIKARASLSNPDTAP
jgi:hypothetical protein